MHFKLIIAFVEDSKTETVMEAARAAGATGATVISNARGEGMKKSKTFLGLSLETQRDVLMFLVEEHLSRQILETVCDIGELDETPGTGIAFQVDVENAVGVEVPLNAQLIRNLVQGIHCLHDHIVHFYALSALDWLDVVCALDADPVRTDGNEFTNLEHLRMIASQ